MSFLYFDIFLSVFSALMMFIWKTDSVVNLLCKMSFFAIMMVSMMRAAVAFGIVLAPPMRLV